MKLKLTINTRPLLAMLFCISVFASCSNNSKKEDVDFNDSVKTANKDQINSVLVHAIVKSIPPPIELTSLIKESGAAYDKSLLNPIESKNKYISSQDKALALGVYAADLGYINFFEKTYEALDYLDVVKELSDQLSIGQFFDFTTIKRLAQNKSSMDSIIYITTDNFEKMNVYLAKQNRGTTSALMLLGGWAESVHLLCKAGNAHKSKSLIEQVGEQKVVLDELLVLLSLFKDNTDFEDLTKHFNELKPLYEKVIIKYEYRAPVTKEVNGTLVVEDNSKKEIVISDEQFDAIANKIEELRNYIIKP
jgi:hypothetical protein